MTWSSAATWFIAALAIGGVLGRPGNLPEALWTSAGAALLVGFRLLPLAAAELAVMKGLDVYLFLAGMMLLSELARREGVFDWCAAQALAHARGSAVRLFLQIYGIGILITVFLSNDATAVVLTPAVLAVAKAAKVQKPLPYLFACALVANAASFVLPISNPANLVLFGGHPLPLLEWMMSFAVPSLLSISATGGILFWITRADLAESVAEPGNSPGLSATGKLALASIALAVCALLIASVCRMNLGLPTLGVAILAICLVFIKDQKVLRDIPREVSWAVLPLVAGLFVIVEALNGAGALPAGQRALETLNHWPSWQRDVAGAFGIAGLSNLINNLPSGLLTGTAVAHTQIPPALRNALLIGVDLGPNFSVTGSLATILWLIALRREKQTVSAWSFLKIGALVTPLALLLAVLASTFLKMR